MKPVLAITLGILALLWACAEFGEAHAAAGIVALAMILFWSQLLRRIIGWLFP
jgi:hypothetical protein